MLVRVPCKLWYCLVLPFALIDNDAGKVLIAPLFILWFESCRSVVAASLVTRRLLELALEKLTFRQVFGGLLLKVVATLVLKYLRSILGWDYLLLLFGQYRSMIWCSWSPLDVIHLYNGWFRDLLLIWLDRGNCHYSTSLVVIKADDITTPVTIELRCNLYRCSIGLLYFSHSWGRITRHLHTETTWLLHAIFLVRFELIIAGYFKFHHQFLRSFIFLLLLLLLDQLILNQSLDLTRVVLSNVCDTFASWPDESFQSQVVACGQGIVLVCLNESASIVSYRIFKGILLKHNLKLLKVNWYWVLANYDSRIVFHAFYLTEPNVTTNVRSCESLGRVSI